MNPGSMHPGVIHSALRAAGWGKHPAGDVTSGGYAELERHGRTQAARVAREAVDELRGGGPLSPRTARLAEALAAIGLDRAQAAALLAGGRRLLTLVPPLRGHQTPADSAH